MANSFDSDGCGPSDERRRCACIALILLVAAMVSMLLLKAQGRFDETIKVTVELVNVGDGLPAKSDMKFRGVLIGAVTDVVAAPARHVNLAQADLNWQLAQGIPNSVTARVVQLAEHNGHAPRPAGDNTAGPRPDTKGRPNSVGPL